MEVQNKNIPEDQRYTVYSIQKKWIPWYFYRVVDRYQTVQTLDTELILAESLPGRYPSHEAAQAAGTRYVALINNPFVVILISLFTANPKYIYYRRSYAQDNQISFWY